MTNRIQIPKYGHHPSINQGYLSAIERPLARGATAIQLWLGNNKGYASKLLPSKVYTPVADLVTDKEVFLISHSPYILNFARPLQTEENGAKALQRYLRDLINITNLGGMGSILHMGSNVKELNQTMDEAYENFVDNLWWVVDKMPPTATIILENMAGGGDQMCAHMNDWADFWNNYVDDELKERIKWCVDTAHLYAAGEYDLSNRSEVMRFYKEFDAQIGWEYLLCFHFNGSKSAFASHHDYHADIGPNKCGVIATSGLRQLARIAGKTSKPLILEVPLDEHTLPEQFNLIESWF